MAEPRGDKGGKKIFSFATKKAKRVHQKMLQKVGQAEKTTDDNYTDFVVNFNKQQLAASRLQKELTKYANSLKVVSINTKSLLDLWSELYEPDWKGHSEFQNIMESKMLLWEDILKKIQDDLMESLLLYMSKFPETKKLVEKRERKIVDHDYAKRELEAARQNRKMTEVKLQQIEESYHDAKATFDEVTDNLYDELPALFDSRIEFYASLFRNMSSIELNFHREMAKLDETYNETMNQLHEEAQSGVHTSKKERILSSETFNPVKSSVGDEENSISDEEDTEGDSESTKDGGGNLSRTSSGKGTPIMQSHSASKPPKPSRSDSTMTDNSISPEDTQEDNVENGSTTITCDVNGKQPPPKPDKPPSVSSLEQEEGESNEQEGNSPVREEEEEEISKEEVTIAEIELPKQEEVVEAEEQQTPPENNDEINESPQQTSSNLGDVAVNPDKELNESMGVLFKVIALHPYTGEDEDELSFDKGDIICVVPYEDPEDEEDGWKMGCVQGTTKKGIFPENFTKPYSD